MNIFELLGQRHTVFSWVGFSGLVEEVLTLDAATQVTPIFSSQATAHPIEDGSDISDHLIKKPIGLTINGIITDTPLTLLAAVAGAAAGLPGRFLGGTAGAVGTAVASKMGSALIGGIGSKPSVSAYQSLVNIHENGIALTITTGLDFYGPMVMENLTIPRNSKTKNSLTFTCKLKTIKIAVSEIVKIPKEAISSDARTSATKKSKLGNAAGKPTTPGAAGKSSSLLFKLFG